MKLPLRPEVSEFMELKMKAGSWERQGIPAEGCRIRTSMFEKILSEGGGYAVEDLIFGLMDWLDVTDDPAPAQATLRQMLDRHYPADGRETARVRFLDENERNFIFHVGPIDTSRPLVAWQRREWLIAAVQPHEEPNRYVAGAPGPISLDVALRILWLSDARDPAGQIDSYEAAQHTSRKTGAFYSWEAGEATPVEWEFGLGLTRQNEALVRSDAVEPPSQGEWLPPNQLVMLIACAAGYLK